MAKKIAAGSVFYNSEDILRFAMWNLVAQGVTNFYFIIHNEVTDEARAILKEFEGFATIRLASKPSAPFLQGRMMTLLAEAARIDGFDYFIPFDSDEFFHPVDDAKPFALELETYFERTQAPALALKYVDHLQPTNVETFDETKLETACYTPAPSGAVDGPVEDNNDISNFFLHHKQKMVVNLGVLPEFGRYAIVEGSHKIEIDGLYPHLEISDSVRIAHVPYRSRAKLFSRKQNAARRAAAGWGQLTAGRLQIISKADEQELDNQWRRVSWQQTPQGVSLVIDNPRLILQESVQMNNAKTRIDAAMAATPAQPVESAEQRAAADQALVGRLFYLAVDLSLGFPRTDFPERQIMQQIIANLGHERDNLAALLRKHAPQVDISLATKLTLAQKVRSKAKQAARKVLGR